ncbi:MAG: FKBP-type peptidyl-prolyl cis-trans isomerase [Candidatus Kapabacteria bacterium]|nr:FKBP-type peptidyl-prolyl cis-trans isomerase [Ignavibacteriota bacterium]MCW5884083.1 FKBP-type peptidyl-prolyl cis-trans isomerase [Candidatus Kapabacteria bacterium]
MIKYYLLILILVLASCGESNSPQESSSASNKEAYQQIIKKYDNTVNEVSGDIVDQFMYVNGYRTALNMMNDSLTLSLDYLVQGFVDALKSGDPKIHKDSMDNIVASFSNFLSERMDSIMKIKEIEYSVIAVQNLSEAEEFIEKNASESGVVTLPSKLQYKILKQGNGKSPTQSDYVLVHMTSTFADGTVFDDTRSGEPRAIPNERMIPGWIEGITNMQEGARWILYLHPALGFGEFGIDGKVPPNKLTIIDVELIKVMTEQEIAEYMKNNPPKPPIPGGPMGGF